MVLAIIFLSLFPNWTNWSRFWGSQLTCLVSPGPFHLDIVQPNRPSELFLTEFQSFYARIKKLGSSCCGVPGSDNVCSRSLICKVNHPRLNYWHPSTDGGLNYDALNQTGVHCNYSHFTQLKNPLCKISIPQTSQITPTNSTPAYHDRMMNTNCEQFSHKSSRNIWVLLGWMVIMALAWSSNWPSHYWEAEFILSSKCLDFPANQCFFGEDLWLVMDTPMWI